jgi:Rieske Fe-S protein
VLDPVDYLPFSGKNPGNESVFVHTGDSGEGLTNAVIGSFILRNLVRGRKAQRTELLDPGRVTLKAAGRFARKNISVASSLAARVIPKTGSAHDLKPGEGAIVGSGAGKVAAYRDEAGSLHLRSAACTHSGCLLSWNSFETCWDCTCHGSHFSVDGEPLNAPAVTPLDEVSTQPARKERTVPAG